MKTILFTTLISLLIFTSAFCQDKTQEKKWTVDPETGDTVYTESLIISKTEDITPRSGMLLINPLKFLLFYNISYMHNVNDKVTVGAGIQTPTLAGINGFGINAEVRIYPKGKNMKGFYIAPNFSYNNLKSTGSSSSASISSIGGLLGWQWFPGDEFAMGLGIGIDYYFTAENNYLFNDYNGTAPALRFDIGYAW